MASKKGSAKKKTAAKAKKAKASKEKAPTQKQKAAAKAFQKDVEKLAVTHGLVNSMAAASSCWEYRIENGKMVLRWIC